MKRTATATFVRTLPLVVQPREDRILSGRMEAGRRLYNATLDEAEFNRLSKEAGFTPAALITFARSTLSTWVSMDKRGGCVMNLRRSSLRARSR